MHEKMEDGTEIPKLNDAEAIIAACRCDEHGAYEAIRRLVAIANPDFNRCPSCGGDLQGMYVPKVEAKSKHFGMDGKEVQPSERFLVCTSCDRQWQRTMREVLEPRRRIDDNG